MLTISLIQMTSSADVAANLAYVEKQLASLSSSSTPRLVMLPECFAVWGGGHYQLRHAEELGGGRIQQQLADWAQRFNIYLLAGTCPIRTASLDKAYACSLLYDPQGHLLAHYNKIHLFDVDVADSTQQYRESHHTQPGEDLAIVDIAGVRVGLAVCYDVRFPELFRRLSEQGVDVIALPSAFTRVTGEAHWHTLLRARAIENQCYVAAAAQVGRHHNGRETYGHSLVVDGWGRILADAGEQPRTLSITIDPATLEQLRRAMPVLKHRRI